MLVYTAKLTKTKLALLVCALFLLLTALIAAVTSVNRARAASQAMALGDAGPASFRNIRTNDDRVAFLKAYGWEVQPDPVAVEDVVIPEDFDDVYARYNELQREQGLDLTKYAGKTVRRYTYTVTNYPGQPENVAADLLILKNRVIAADICSTEYRGFMHGLIGR